MAGSNEDNEINRILDEEAQDDNEPSEDPSQCNLGILPLHQTSRANFWTQIGSNIDKPINYALENKVGDPPTEWNNGNAQKISNYNRISRISSDSPNESDGGNVRQNNQAQSSSEETTDDSDKNDDMVLSITQEYENVEKFSFTVDDKIKTLFQDLIWCNFKNQKLDSVLDTTHTLENLQSLNVCKINPEFWRKFSRSTRSFRFKLQNA